MMIASLLSENIINFLLTNARLLPGIYIQIGWTSLPDICTSGVV